MATTKKPQPKKSSKPSKVSGDSILQQTVRMGELAKESEDNGRKFIDEEVKAAGKRLRQNAMELKKICQQLRKDVMAVIKQRKGAK